ncbi:hypothetical protein QYF36_006108 [Acer negundo]|nr:hypothetical protein QYF36_006108 [Acer negundo]
MVTIGVCNAGKCLVSDLKRAEGVVLWIVIRFMKLEANMSYKAANLIAIHKGLQFGIDCGLSPHVIELDDKKVIAWVNSGSHFDSTFGAILMDINMPMEDMDGEDEEDRFGGGSISSAVNLLFFFSLGGGGWRQRGRSIDGSGLGFDRSMVMFLGLMMLVQI